MSRADKLYAVLADGRRHSRHEIFRECGEFFLTNNAASELRAKRCLTVEHTVEDGEHYYRIASPLEDPGAPTRRFSLPARPSPHAPGSSSEDATAGKADGETVSDGDSVLSLFDPEAVAA